MPAEIRGFRLMRRGVARPALVAGCVLAPVPASGTSSVEVPTASAVAGQTGLMHDAIGPIEEKTPITLQIDFQAAAAGDVPDPRMRMHLDYLRSPELRAAFAGDG
jgi:hypothetical protein